jgi:hypothetical protein
MHLAQVSMLYISTFSNAPKLYKKYSPIIFRKWNGVLDCSLTLCSHPGNMAAVSRLRALASVARVPSITRWFSSSAAAAEIAKVRSEVELVVFVG